MKIKGLWWKLLSLGLMLYVVIAGMLVPLKPGVSGISERLIKAGETTELVVTGYNTHFQSAPNTRGWLRLGRPTASNQPDTAIAAVAFEANSEQLARITFELPRYVPTTRGRATATLILDNELDGAFVLPAAIDIVEAKGLAGPPNYAVWTSSLEDLHTAKGMSYPYLGLLGETIRNQFFHVSLWFALMLLMLTASVYAVRYLIGGNPEFDRRSEALTQVGLTFGILGLLTGMVWAHYAWGKAWSGDIKQEMTAIALLIYAAYFVLRNSIRSEQQSARVSAVYNVFAFVMLIPLLYIIPRVTDSLHPGAGGNPGFGGEDLDNTMRMVFYPGIIGFTLLGVWIAELFWRARRLAARHELRLARRGSS